MTTPLYPSEAEIALLVLGKRARDWSQIVGFLEDKEGLPRVDPLMGGRYWPAVEDFFRRRNARTTVDVGSLTRPLSGRVRRVPPRVTNGPEASASFDQRNRN